MLYIFIGPDGSGKTTLAKKVTEKGNMEYYKFSNKEDNKDWLAVQMLNRVKHDETGKSFVFDRFYYPDNLIYNNVKGIEHEEEWLQTINILSNMEVTWVYVTALDFKLEERISDRGDDYINTDELYDIKEGYKSWLKDVRTLFPNHLFLTVDTSIDRYDIEL